MYANDDPCATHSVERVFRNNRTLHSLHYYTTCSSNRHHHDNRCHWMLPTPPFPLFKIRNKVNVYLQRLVIQMFIHVELSDQDR